MHQHRAFSTRHLTIPFHSTSTRRGRFVQNFLEVFFLVFPFFLLLAFRRCCEIVLPPLPLLHSSYGLSSSTSPRNQLSYTPTHPLYATRRLHTFSLIPLACLTFGPPPRTYIWTRFRIPPYTPFPQLPTPRMSPLFLPHYAGYFVFLSILTPTPHPYPHPHPRIMLHAHPFSLHHMVLVDIGLILVLCCRCCFHSLFSFFLP